MTEAPIKYSLVENDQIVTDKGVTLTRIKAEKDIHFPYQGPNHPAFVVKKGDLGGYIENEINLDQKGMAWIDQTSTVEGLAYVHGQALISDHSSLRDDAEVYDFARIRQSSLQENSSAFGRTLVIGANLSGNMELDSGTFINPEHPTQSHEKSAPAISQKNSRQIIPTENFMIEEQINPIDRSKYNTIITIAQRKGDQIIYKECGKINSLEDGAISINLDHEILNEQNPIFTDSIDEMGHPDKYGDLAKSLRNHIEQKFDREGTLPERIYTKWTNNNIEEHLPIISIMTENSMGFLPYSPNELDALEDRMPILQCSKQSGHLNTFDLRGLKNPTFMLEVPRQDEDFPFTTIMFKTDSGADLSGLKLFEGDKIPERLNFIFSTSDRHDDVRPRHENALLDFPDLKPTIAKSGGNTSIRIMGKDLLYPERLYKSIGGPVGNLEVPSGTSFEKIKAYAKQSPNSLARTITTSQSNRSEPQETFGWNDLKETRKRTPKIEPPQTSFSF